MLWSSRMFKQWRFAVFLLCSPVPLYGRPINTLSNRMRRSVTHAQLMHDKGRTLQDFKRRMWLMELLEEVHTAEIRDPEQRKSRPNSPTVSWNSHHLKPADRAKNFSLGFVLEDVGTDFYLPQETHKALSYKDQPLKAVVKRKKKMRLGRRRESEKRLRRVRSVQLWGHQQG